MGGGPRSRLDIFQVLSQFNTMNNLLSLAPYGLGPLVAAYGAARGARAAYSSVSRRPAYRKARRVPRSLRIRGLHTFRRTVNFPLVYTPNAGFVSGALSGSSATFTFSLSELRMYLGAGSVAFAIPSYTDFTNLFDAWRIKSVKISMFFQNTSSTVASATTNMPLLVHAWDYEDNSVDASSAINQKDNSKRFQFGNGSAPMGALVTYGKPRATSTGPLTFGGSAGLKQEPAKTWLETTHPEVQYNAWKVYVDGFAATQATTEGSFSTYVDIVYELKDVV